MAERAQDAQIEQVKTAQENLRRDVRRGQWLGFVAVSLAMGGALLAVKLGSPVVAGLFLSVTMTAVIKALIDSARGQSQLASTPTNSQLTIPKPPETSNTDSNA